jgi:hypothetical protein
MIKEAQLFCYRLGTEESKMKGRNGAKQSRSQDFLS